jgi:hypothetical protein
MPDATPSLSSGPGAEPAVYRPVSVLAVAGLSAAVVYALVVVLVAGSAWRSGVPRLMSWALVLAVAGALLSLTARVRILRSAGMQAGLRLANWGLGLCVVLGLVHGAILIGKDLAVRQEARAFTADWFELLRQGDVYRAFLLSVPAAQRQGDDPENLRRLYIRYGTAGLGEKGPLLRFLENELVQIVRQAGADTKVESLGVSDWAFIDGGYLVEQSYRVTTPEGVFDIALRARSAEQPVPGSVGRQWHIVMTDPNIVRSRHPTPLGEQLIALRQNAGRFVEDWARRATAPSAEHFGTAQLLTPSDRITQAIRQEIRELGRSSSLQIKAPSGPELDSCPWKIAGSELQFTVPIELRLGSKYYCEGNATVAVQAPQLIQQLPQAASGLPMPGADQWRVIGFDLLIGSEGKPIGRADFRIPHSSILRAVASRRAPLRLRGST